MKKPLLFPLMCSALFPCWVSADASISSTQIERIEVTADGLSRRLAELSPSVDLLSADEIRLSHSPFLEDSLLKQSNLNFNSGASRGRFIQIRGIGDRSLFAEPLTPSVGLVVDGVDISGIGGALNVFDVSQVEVLKGPQAQTAGISALAGVINVSTADPFNAKNYSRVSAGQQDYRKLEAAVGIAGQQHALRFAVVDTYDRGNITNQFIGRDDTNRVDEHAFRLTSGHRFGATELDLAVSSIRADNGYDAFSLDNDRITQSDQPGFDRTDSDAIRLNVLHEFNHFTLQLKASHSDTLLDYGYDEDWTFVGFHPDGYRSFDQYTRQIEQDVIALEVQRGNAMVDWLLGIQEKRQTQDLRRQYTFNEADFVSQFTPEQQAIYGELEHRINARMLASVSVKFEQQSLNYRDSSGFSEQLEEEVVAASAQWRYSFAQATVFVSLGRGYKLGGFNPDQRIANTDRTYDAEYNTSVELGLRARINDALDTDLTLFSMQRDDAQVNDFLVLSRDDGSVEFIDVVRNAAKATNQGVEWSLNYQARDNWRLSAELGWLDTEFGDYQRLDGSVVGNQEQAQAPNYTAYMASDYRFEWFGAPALWRLEASAMDGYRFSDGHEERAPSKSLLHTQLEFGITDDSRLTVWVRNLTDEGYPTRGFGGFSNDPRDGYATPEPYFQFAEGRKIGVTYGIDF